MMTLEQYQAAAPMMVILLLGVSVMWAMSVRSDADNRRKLEQLEQPEVPVVRDSTRCRCGEPWTVWRIGHGYLCPVCLAQSLRPKHPCEICGSVPAIHETWDGQQCVIRICTDCRREELEIEAMVKGGAA